MATTSKLNIIGLKAPIQHHKELAPQTWLGVGGQAEFYIEPQDITDLQLILSQNPNLPITLLGAGSNVLIRDAGISGLVIHLANGFKNYTVDKNKITAGAGLSLIKLATIAAECGLSGFEFMSGIPGSLGGGLKMNAGAYGSDLSALCTQVVFMDKEGKIHKINPKTTDFFAYRQSALPPDGIFIEATLEGTPKNKNEILQTMADLKQKRQSTQPQGVKTAGSTFKNPPDCAAWKLIDEAGLRGYTHNGAKISEKHSNFMINANNATATDLEELGEFVRQQVKQKTGHTLEWEIKIIGKKEK